MGVAGCESCDDGPRGGLFSRSAPEPGSLLDSIDPCGVTPSTTVPATLRRGAPADRRPQAGDFADAHGLISASFARARLSRAGAVAFSLRIATGAPEVFA